MQTISVGIIAYNEADNLGVLLEQLKKQDYPLSQTEIILVDGKSTDNTLEIMNRFKSENEKEFFGVQVLINEKRIQPSGWKIVVENFKCDMLVRLDAHSRIGNDFVPKNVECIQSGEYVCGGIRTNISDGKANDMLLIAEKSMFGSGIAKYRNDTDKKEYVKTVAHACYRREVFEKAGNFNETIARAEDNEMHFRIRKAGYKICMSPSIRSEYLTRSTFKGMLKQKYGNGKWIGITSLAVSPSVFSIYHFVPFLFVMALILSAALAVVGACLSSIWWAIPFFAVFGSYLVVDLGLTLLCAKANKKPSAIFVLPWLFFFLHTAYGVGTFLGVISLGKIVKVKKYEREQVKNG